MAAHLYWRLNISANAGDANYLQAAEVEMRATAGGADQCTGGTATASSEYSVDFAAAKAFDNDAATRWSTVAGVTSGWIAYQFTAAVEVLEYTIQASSVAGARSPKDWNLEWSDDGTNWTIVETREGYGTWATGEIKTFTLSTSPATQTVSQVAAEVLAKPTAASALRTSQVLTEIAQRPVSSALRTSQVGIEVAQRPVSSAARTSQVAIEVLHKPRTSVIALSDPFTGTTIDTAKWLVGSGTEVTKTQNNELVLTRADGSTQYDGLYSANTYNMTSGHVFVALKQAGANAAGAETQFYVYDDVTAGYSLDIVRAENQLVFRRQEAGTYTTLHGIPYNDAEPQWLKIGVLNGKVTFYTAPIATSSNPPTLSEWTNNGSYTVGSVPTNAMRVALVNGAWQVHAGVSKVVFDGLNTEAVANLDLVDGFDGTTIDTVKWTVNQPAGITVTQSNDLRIAVDPNATPYGGLESASQYDFTGKEVFVKLVQQSSSTTGAEDHFDVISNNATYDRFVIVRSGTSLHFQKREADVTTTIATVPFTNGTWLKIANIAGKTTFHTAPGTGSNPPATSEWTKQAETTYGFAINAMRVRLRTGCYQAVADPGVVVWDGLNTGAIAPAAIDSTVSTSQSQVTSSSVAAFTPPTHSKLRTYVVEKQLRSLAAIQAQDRLLPPIKAQNRNAPKAIPQTRPFKVGRLQNREYVVKYVLS